MNSNKKVEQFSMDALIKDMDEDFFNAIDVLKCIMHDENHSIVKELICIYERKSKLLYSAWTGSLPEATRFGTDSKNKRPL